MSVLSKEADVVVRWSSAERTRALKRIIPQVAIEKALRRATQRPIGLVIIRVLRVLLLKNNIRTEGREAHEEMRSFNSVEALIRQTAEVLPQSEVDPGLRSRWTGFAGRTTMNFRHRQLALGFLAWEHVYEALVEYSDFVRVVVASGCRSN